MITLTRFENFIFTWIAKRAFARTGMAKGTVTLSCYCWDDNQVKE